MTGFVFLVVILAAILHAGWNALVKGGTDKTVSMTAVVIGQGICGLILIPFAMPLNDEALPYLALGILLHIGYQVFLILAYRLGDLTQVYPIARGVAPLLVALGSFLWFGVTFAPLQVLAIGMISVGIASISLVRRADGVFQGRAAAAALITGMFIASYSIVDGYGARAAGTALGYFAWLAFVGSVLFSVMMRVARPGTLSQSLQARGALILGGGASFLAYLLVIWAFTQAPIALVTALRETSIVFALIIGVALMGERLNLAKVASTVMTLGGAILLRIYR